MILSFLLLRFYFREANLHAAGTSSIDLESTPMPVEAKTLLDVAADETLVTSAEIVPYSQVIPSTEVLNGEASALAWIVVLNGPLRATNFD